MCESGQIQALGKTSVKIEGFVNMIQVFRSGLESYGISGMIKAILEYTDYAEYLKDQDDESAEDRLSNIDELITKAVGYEESHDEPSLSEFLEEIALVADIDNVEDGDNRVLLMTLHSAKGLEFPYVYMTGLEDGLFPSYMSIVSDDNEDVEEERRLAYVGITRAMDDLTLTCAKSRMLRGETQYNSISRFVREIPTALMDNTTPELKKTKAQREMENFLLGGNRNVSVSAFDARPKAVLKPRTTAKADKPFIAKGIGELNRMAGLQKGIEHVAPEELDYTVGDRVKHIKYGEGTVMGISREPRDYKVTVDFDNAGQKIMYATFAKLKRV
jgi:DNA helicase-2/ATP-dependent DNA helicase PcrA